VADEKKIREMVRRVVYRTVGKQPSSTPPTKRVLVTELDIKDLPVGSDFEVPEDALVTPLARQVAMDRKVNLVEAGMTSAAVEAPPSPTPAGRKVVAVGADHGGFTLKETLKATLVELGYSVIDCGTDSTKSVDYPDFAFAVAQLVAQGKAWRGVIVDGAGIGSCMVANKVPGVRAAMCYDQSTAVNSREHNDANVLTLGAGLIGTNLSQQIVATWLATGSGGGRHARRVDKIMEIERRFLKR
jgi:ribose 5-phosphate isomerase B